MTDTSRSERIRTRHPQGRQGVNILRSKYEEMRKALLRIIPRRKAGVPFKLLSAVVRKQLKPKVFGPDDSIPWYVVVVKQDLEARGQIEQVPAKRPQHLRRTRGRIP